MKHSTTPIIEKESHLKKKIEQNIDNEIQVIEVSEVMFEMVGNPKKRKNEESFEKNKKNNKIINVYTDGGCSNNGFKNASAGIGIYFEDGQYQNVSKKIQGKQTNNRAELTAILEALKIVHTNEDVLIHTDSEYSINGITGINKIHKNEDLFDSIKKIISQRKGSTKFKKVEGHSGLKDGNYYADELATQALN